MSELTDLTAKVRETRKEARGMALPGSPMYEFWDQRVFRLCDLAEAQEREIVETKADFIRLQESCGCLVARTQNAEDELARLRGLLAAWAEAVRALAALEDDVKSSPAVTEELVARLSGLESAIEDAEFEVFKEAQRLAAEKEKEKCGSSSSS